MRSDVCAKLLYKSGPWFVAAPWQLVLILVLACMPAASPLAKMQQPTGDLQQEYEAAVTTYNDGNYGEALVHLKNALQARNDHLPSRLLIGSTYMRLGQPAEAVKELRIALRLGAARDQVIVPLGNAMLMLRDYQGILDTIDAVGLGGSQRYEVLVIRARALLELGRLDEAEKGFDDAIAVEPRSMEAFLGKSQVYSVREDWPKAEELIDAARDRAPDSAELWYEKGQLRRNQNDAEGALAAYERALQLNGAHVRAHKARAALYVELGQYDKALPDAEYAHTKVPKDPDAALTYGLVLMGLGREDESKEAIRAAFEQVKLIKDDVLMQQPGLLRVAALTSALRGDMEQANAYADQYLKLKPHSAEMRKLSGRIKLTLDDPKAAISVLLPLARTRANDAESLALLGEAYLRSGRYAEAQSVLERAAALVPDSAQIGTRLALARLGIGMADEAVGDLGRAVGEDTANRTSAGIIKVSLHLRRGERDEALATARELLARQPHNPLLHNLLGAVYLSRGELPQARAAFEAALKEAPDFVPALYNLGMMDQKQGDLAAAEARYREVLTINPNEVNALLAQADLALSRGQLEPAIAPLLKAISADPSNVDPHVRVISVYLNLGNTIEAQRQARELQARFPESGIAAEMMARVEVAMGNNKSAANNFRNAARFTSFDGDALLRIADEQGKLGDTEGARATLLKAVDTARRDDANSRLVQLYLRNNDLEGAWKYARQVSAQSPESWLGDMLAGQIHMAEGEPAKALAAFEAGFRKQPRSDLLFGRYQALFALGRADDALQLFESWLQAHPRDVDVRRNLAVGYLSRGQQGKARAHLEELIELAPNDATGLSALARIYQLGGDPRARELAERAVKIAPEWSVPLDTYGWILVTEGRPEEGLNYLREAVSRDSNPLMRFHLAQALKQLGRTAEARVELDTILRARQQPEWIDDARKLRESL